MQDDVIPALYEAFAGYRPRPDHPYCNSCCVAEEDVEALLNRPLHELDADFAIHFLGNALMTWGGEPEFNYALPRMLELVLAGEVDYDWIGFPYRIARVRANWAAAENAAVDQFNHAYWQDRFTRPAAWSHTMLDVLKDIGESGTPVRPLLDGWAARTDALADQHRVYALRDLNLSVEADGGWYRDVVGSLTSPLAVARVRAAAQGALGPEFVEPAQDALAGLE
jgi:hypothetical protein